LDAQGNITTEGAPTPFTGHDGAPVTQLRNWSYNDNDKELKIRYPDFKTTKGRTISPLEIYNTIAKMPSQDQTSSFAIPAAANQADINRYIDQALIQFITGQKPLNDSTWKAFVDGLSGVNAAAWEETATKALKDKKLL
jgi:hypothetical protein